MKNILFILLAFASVNLAVAQKNIEIEFTKDKEVIVNNTKLSKESSFQDIKELLGEPTIYKNFRSGKINYHYENLGIAFHTINNKLVFFGINFNWDGDESFPEKEYNGTFKIDDLSINKESKKSIIDTIKIVELKCIVPSLCVSNPEIEKTPIIIGFNNSLITQIGFEFH